MQKFDTTRLQKPIYVAVIMACHNRAKVTKRFFDSFAGSNRDGFRFKFFITDDASVDETRSMLNNLPFDINIFDGNGKLFWAKSMALAEDQIKEVPDGILWINDDVILDFDAFTKLEKGIRANQHSVLIGQIQDVKTGQILYGGYKRLGAHPLVLKLLNSEISYTKVDTFNGNFVYIPIEVRLAVGKIESRYKHAYADCDYGYRVNNAGYEAIVMPGFVGKTNSNIPSWPKGRVQKVKQLMSKKHNPVSSQFLFFRRHTKALVAFLIPYYILRPFVRILVTNVGTSRGDNLR